MKLEGAGYIIGLLGLLVALFPKSIEHEDLLFWIGVVGIVFGLAVFVRARLRRIHIELFLRRRAQLENILTVVSSELKLKRSWLTSVVEKLARAGRVTLYGEHGSSNKLTPIPSQYFENYQLLYDPLTGTVRTFDPRRMMSDQDPDRLYFNLYAHMELIEILKTTIKSDGASASVYLGESSSM